MPDVNVYVYEADGEYRVYPPVVTLKKSADTLVLQNYTSEDVVLFAPDGALSANPEADAVRPKNKKNRSASAATVGLHTYQVFAPKSGKKAKGNSDPVIIIEP